MTDDVGGVTSSVTCAWCGSTAAPAPPTWTLSSGERGSEWLCERCTREQVRNIESKLDSSWW